jgi:hypothetical protein
LIRLYHLLSHNSSTAVSGDLAGGNPGGESDVTVLFPGVNHHNDRVVSRSPRSRTCTQDAYLTCPDESTQLGCVGQMLLRNTTTLWAVALAIVILPSSERPQTQTIRLSASPDCWVTYRAKNLRNEYVQTLFQTVHSFLVKVTRPDSFGHVQQLHGAHVPERM